MSDDHSQYSEPELPRPNDRGETPKAMITRGRYSREKDRVFVSMPFKAPHSDALLRTLRGVCDIQGLEMTRADSTNRSSLVLADILEELERAEIIVVDLTNLNSNVLYELGMAHVRCDSVILIAEQGQELPFDLASMRCIFFDLGSAEGRLAFAERLGRGVREFKTEGAPSIIDSPLKRTKVIIDDLQTLAHSTDDLSRETVWFSGSLSAFAISPQENFAPEEREYHQALLQEKEALLDLARNGCVVKGLITPPASMAVIYDKSDRILARAKYLLEFLESSDPAHESIDWVLSPFRQKNMYIIGRISYVEGFKKDVQRGYGLTLRQTTLDAITAMTALYEALFERMVPLTIRDYYHGREGIPIRQVLRHATINCLKQSLELHES